MLNFDIGILKILENNQTVILTLTSRFIIKEGFKVVEKKE